MLIFQIATNREGTEHQIIIEDKEIDQSVKHVAKIGNHDIHYDDWQQQLFDEYGKKVLTDMVNKEVVLQLAEEKNLEVPEKFMERELARMYMMHGVLSKEKEEQLREKWQEQIEYRFFLQELLIEDSAVEDSKLEEYFDTYKNQYQFSEMLQFSHITVATQEEANRVKELLDDGEKFGSLANQYSIDEDTNENDGYLGYYSDTTNFLPAIYFDIAEELDEGEYSDPYLLNGGYVIVKLHRILPAIEFTYEEAYREVRQDVILDEYPSDLNAKDLWNESDVEMIYEKE